MRRGKRQTELGDCTCGAPQKRHRKGGVVCSRGGVLCLGKGSRYYKQIKQKETEKRNAKFVADGFYACNSQQPQDQFSNGCLCVACVIDRGEKEFVKADGSLYLLRKNELYFLG